MKEPYNKLNILFLRQVWNSSRLQNSQQGNREICLESLIMLSVGEDLEPLQDIWSCLKHHKRFIAIRHSIHNKSSLIFSPVQNHLAWTKYVHGYFG